MKINFDLQTLRSFIKVAEMGSFTKAADALRLTQPAISQQIKRLEELLNVELLARETRGVQLTPAGERLSAYARQIVELNDSACQEFNKVGRKAIVHLGMPEHFSDLMLPTIIGDVHELFQEVQLVVKIARSALISDYVNDGKVDLGIIIDEIGKHPSALAREIPVKWFASEKANVAKYGEIPLVLFRSPCAFRNLAIRRLEESGLSWRCVYESEDLVSLRSAVIADVGVTVLPYLREMQGLRDVNATGVLPSLPRFEVALRERAGWDPSFKRAFINRLMSIWNNFQSEAAIYLPEALA